MKVAQLIKDQSGTTLIDLIVAIALLAIAITSAGAFASAGARAGNEAGRRTQATALASRELEGLRAAVDVNQRGNWPFPLSATSRDSAGCETFVMRRSGDGWALAAAATAQTYAAADENGNPDYDNIYSTFSRLVTACDSRDFNPTNPPGLSGSRSPLVKRVEVRVYWQEARGPQREASFNTVLTKWGP